MDNFDQPKLSILNTTKKEWQDRKRWWVTTHNIQSELGRDLTLGNRGRFDINNGKGEKFVSIFDPTLCELMYKWFCPPNGKILDPFAGGSVRGIVAEELGFKYTGIELLETQVRANQSQSSKPKWIIGDSNKVLDTISSSYNFLFSCPPYHDLEIYSDNEDDLSYMDWDTFIINYKSIIKKSYNKLEDNSFACFVITELREYNSEGRYSEGYYKGFISKTIESFEEAGFKYYNDIILLNSTGNASKVANTYFTKNRKIASAHQNILIFVKGNPDLATIKITQEEDTHCIVKGIEYKSFREASLHLNMSAYEVERRCNSPKIHYLQYQIKGVTKKPHYSLSIDGALFESPKDATRYINLTESEIYNRIISNRGIYRHYLKLPTPITDISYEENEITLRNKIIRLELPIISCEEKEYYSLKEAGEDLGITSERVRQKLIDKNHNSYYYLQYL